MTTCGGGGIIPASRFLRRRAAVRDLGRDAAAEADAFWAAPPRLYDFSQQQQQKLEEKEDPHPAVAQRSPPPEPEPCSPNPIIFVRRRSAQRSPEPEACSPSPLAALRSPSLGPESTSLLLALQRTCVGWGATKRLEYPSRHRPASPSQAAVEGMNRLAAAATPCGGEDQQSASVGGGGDKKRKWLEEAGKDDDEAGKEIGREEDKPVVPAKAGKSRSRNKRKARWSNLRRRRAARRAAKKATRAVKEEQDAAAAAEEEEENSQDVRPAVVEAEKERKSRKRPGSSAHGRSPAAAKRAKKGPLKEEKVEEDEELAEEEEEEAESKPATPAPASKPERGSPGGKVERWSAWRYAAGEAALLDILRARGAIAGKPAPRAELRAKARRHIGDTGLLDHLLRHIADKVPSGSGERVRRRYNPAGGMEYWLEPAELAAMRREAGVDDPFWVPPPGWKLGEPVTPEARTLEVQKQVVELAEELDVVKRQMKQLDSNLVQVSKEAYISWKGYDCMVKANGKLEKEVLSLEEKYENATQVNGELKELLLLLKEKYETVLEKNDKLEGQMVALSTSFQSLKEDMLLQRIGEQPMLMLDQEPWDADKQEASAGNVAAGAGNQLTDADPVDGSFNSNGGASDSASAEMALRKCSVRICRRDGMLQWPKPESGGTATSPRELPEPLTPGADLVITDFDAVISSLAPPSMEEYLMAEGLHTPTSASSTNNAASPKLPLLPAPASPIEVQPPPLQSTAMTTGDLQAVQQPYTGDLNLQLRRKDTSSSSPGPCGGKALKLDAGAGGGVVGTELALATPTY
ncbi:hypothetical protein HU200_060966 [Digitaria exilis]|uniref:PTC1-like winged helix-turn-helix domain-containing protein n=1 Tax=Digitaria exilis TaxID=1010633 RepID=A0A835A819_9POAL|nr:hypothetical protein HU200_060966 [Digitaria exilis]CAB3462677.1 unnamed protein product [Digitaria exilis]